MLSGQGGQLGKLLARAVLSVAATAMAVTLLAPIASGSPIGDAEAAMMSAWEKAGGDTSTLGARKGDVYPVADGFALDFDGGRMYFTPATGAKFMFGPILDKYNSLGGPADSDLGFPTISEVPGLAGPDSRVSTFAASDNPVIFWTPEHGAFVVRGALNTAWDKLGSSGGVLGAPIGDETYDGEATAQKFTGGQVSWNRKTKEFTTNPPAFADQLKGLQVAIDPTAAINMAWRASGGANGPLGAKKGAQYPIGGDGIAQDFNSGKIFFSPATGANAVEGPILQKYESLGGPVGSDLGFPVVNEADGGITPASRIVTFSAADKPVIFWTPDHGAVVVRGAMKAAWDKLKGATGKLGAPVGDQTVDADVVSQKFTGGKVSWNRAKNTFTTDPANLAPLLSGLQVSGQNQPSNSAAAPHDKKFTWHWWWLVAAVPVLLLLLMSVLVVLGLRRRRAGRDATPFAPSFEPDHAPEPGAELAADGGEHWRGDDLDFGSEQFPAVEAPSEESLGIDAGGSGRVSWPRGAGGTTDTDERVSGEGAYGDAHPPGPDEGIGFDDEDPDRVDTTPIPPLTEFVDPADIEPDAPQTADPEQFGRDEFSSQEIASDDGWGRETVIPAVGGARPEDLREPAPRPLDPAFSDFFHPAGASADGPVADTRVTDKIPTPAGIRGRHAAADSAHFDAYKDARDDARDDAYDDAYEVARDDARDDAYDDAYEVAQDDAYRDAYRDGEAGRQATAELPYDAAPEAVRRTAAPPPPSAAARPTLRLPMEDPYQVPDGYPIKANASFGLYYTPSSALYHDTLAEVWFASEEAAQASGFVQAD